MATIDDVKKAYLKARFPVVFEKEHKRLSQFFSGDNLTQKITGDIEGEWEELQSSMDQAALYFFEELGGHFPPMVIDKIGAEMQLLDQELSQMKDLTSQLKLDPSSSVLLDTIYQLAKKLMRKREFSKSGSLFSLLSLAAPQVFDFWMGLGMSYQETGETRQALTAYTTAQNIKNNAHPLPLMYMAECHLTLGDRKTAKEMLQTAAQLIESKPEFKVYSAEIQQIREKINKNAR